MRDAFEHKPATPDRHRPRALSGDLDNDLENFMAFVLRGIAYFALAS
jgi:hypothetical protein